MIRKISKITFIGISIILVFYFLYVKSVFRVEYEFNADLPNSSVVIRIENAWTWIPRLRQWNGDRNMVYVLSIDKSEFPGFISSIENCLECTDKTITKGQMFSIFPVKYVDVQQVNILEVRFDKIIFEYSLNYN